MLRLRRPRAGGAIVSALPRHATLHIAPGLVPGERGFPRGYDVRFKQPGCKLGEPGGERLERADEECKNLIPPRQVRGGGDTTTRSALKPVFYLKPG